MSQKDDLISRKAAIKAIRKDMYADKDYMSAMICEGIEDVLNGVPSAEPERTCEYWDSESNFCTLCRPSAQPSVSDCLGCNCPKMERLKEQKTFSEMVRLHDAETHCGAYMRGGEK